MCHKMASGFPSTSYRGPAGSNLAGTRNSRVAPKSAPGTGASLQDSASQRLRPQRDPRAPQRSALQQEDDDDAFRVAVSSASLSQVRPSESGPLSEWGYDSEENPSEEYLDTTPWAREQRARQRWKEGVFKREAERERIRESEESPSEEYLDTTPWAREQRARQRWIREERERRGLVLGTDNPDPKPTTSRRRQREDLDLLFKEKEEEANREKARKLLDRQPTRGERRAAKRTQQYLSAQRARRWAAESDAETEEPHEFLSQQRRGELGLISR